MKIKSTKTRIVRINRALYIVECVYCKKVLASASDREYLPVLFICDCTKNTTDEN